MHLLLCFFSLHYCRLFHRQSLRFMLVRRTNGQHSIFASKMERACLTWWRHAGPLLCIRWRQQFRASLVPHLKTNISRVGDAKVGFTLLFLIYLYFCSRKIDRIWLLAFLFYFLNSLIMVGVQHSRMPSYVLCGKCRASMQFMCGFTGISWYPYSRRW